MRRGLVLVVLAAAVIVAWLWFFGWQRAQIDAATGGVTAPAAVIG